MKISVGIRILSFIFPQVLQTLSSEQHPFLQMQLYHNRLQLCTATAIYSDEANYKPLRVAFNKLKHTMHSNQHMLFLGTGLASGLHLLNRVRLFPYCTLVDFDSEILSLAEQYMPVSFAGRATFVHQDAYGFVQHTTQEYDFVIVDIFVDTVVPFFVTQTTFIRKCKGILKEGAGYMVMNFIQTDVAHKQLLQQRIEQVFTDVQQIVLGNNIVFIAKA